MQTVAKHNHSFSKIMNKTLLIIALLVSTISFCQEKWTLTETGVGIIEIGKPIEKLVKELKAPLSAKKGFMNGYFIMENGKIIMIVSPLKNSKIIGSIIIQTNKFSTKDNLKLGTKIKELYYENIPFFLQYDKNANAEYFYRDKEIIIDNKKYISRIKFFFSGEKPDLLGKYQIEKETIISNKSYENNPDGKIRTITIEVQ